MQCSPDFLTVFRTQLILIKVCGKIVRREIYSPVEMNRFLKAAVYIRKLCYNFTAEGVAKHTTNGCHVSYSRNEAKGKGRNVALLEGEREDLKRKETLP